MIRIDNGFLKTGVYPVISSKGGAMFEYVLFGAVLVGLFFFHKHGTKIAFWGAALLLLYKIFFVADFALGAHLLHESTTLINIFGLIVGFTLLADIFEQTRIADILPRYLSDSWWGGVQLLGAIFLMSAFLDNIAAAMIGGALAKNLYKGKVDVGFLASIVSASNAGGAWSVIGDTTTTMMWIAGKSPLEVAHAIIASMVVFFICAPIAAYQQHKVQPIVKDNLVGARLDWLPAAVVFGILASAVSVNLWFNTHNPDLLKNAPIMAIAVWVAIVIGSAKVSMNWLVAGKATKDATFLAMLVLCASLMPLEQLPSPSINSTFALGIVSAVFDNIPLTALAIKQGEYDWGALAFSVGHGGSLMWFGSSAGVALCGMFAYAKDPILWIKRGWYIIVAHVVAYWVLIGSYGWHPTP